MSDIDDDEDLDPEEAERRISAFVAEADALPGPPVAELADAVAGIVDGSWSRIAELMAGVPHNKLLATMLLVGQRARTCSPDQAEQWRLHAASTLLSGMVTLPE